MSDLKSKLPDFKELGEMTKKLYKDIRSSVSEIIDTYKQKHPDNTADTKEKDSDDKKVVKKPKSTEKEPDQTS